MKFKLLSGRIERATRHSAAFDLFYAGDEPIEVRDSPVAIPTGVRAEFSPGLVAVIKENSALALKGLEVKAGIVDSDFHLAGHDFNEWHVIVRRPRREMDMQGYRFTIRPGDKVAQFLLIELPRVEYEGDGIVFRDEARVGGFGSTN